MNLCDLLTMFAYDSWINIILKQGSSAGVRQLLLFDVM